MAHGGGRCPRGSLPPSNPVPAPSAVAAAAATGVAAAAGNKGKDLYSDLARYGIMDEFDMAPLPFFSSTAATAAAPAVLSPLAPPAPAPSGHPKPRPDPGAQPSDSAPKEQHSDTEGLQWDGTKTGSASVPRRGAPSQRQGGLGEARVPSGSAVSSSSAAALAPAPSPSAAAAGRTSASGGHRSLGDEAVLGAWCVYLLLAADEKKTYVGVTNDVDRRVKQHNGEVVGGSKSTRAGRPWRLLCRVSGFQTRSEAFQFEWRWKNPRAIKGDGSFDKDSMAPSAQILRRSEAARREVGAGQTVPLVVEKRHAALEETLRSFPKWRYLQVHWAGEEELPRR